MALSGFIKQLLETDTVFGSEAKKATGINDSIIRIYFQRVTASFNITSNSFELVIRDYDTTVSTPQWLIPDKYIKFIFFNVDSSQPATGSLSSYVGTLFQIQSVTLDSVDNTLTIAFKPGVLGTPPFSTLPQIDSITDLDIQLDGRIFALIGDPTIAREASNGSTMFNLDNVDVSPFLEADSSGIARKFASHYHTDVTSELVVHDKDDAGFDLIRIAILEEGREETIDYDEAQALIEAQKNPPVVTTANTFIEFKVSGVTTKVAEFGVPAKILSGVFMRMAYSDSNPALVPRGASADLVLTNHDGIKFRDHEWYVNLNESQNTEGRRNWLVFNAGQFRSDIAIDMAAAEIVEQLNLLNGDMYIFSVGEVINNELQILYESRVPGLDMSEVTIMTRSGSSPVLFHDASDVNPGTDPQVNGPLQFVTEAQLVSLLRSEGGKLGITINDEGGVITVGTDTDIDKTFTVTVPDTDPPVFFNINANKGLVDLLVTNGLFRTLTSHPDLVFDSEGNAVFSIPSFIQVGR